MSRTEENRVFSENSSYFVGITGTLWKTDNPEERNMLRSIFEVFAVFVQVFLQVTVLVIKIVLEVCYKLVCSFEQAISKPAEKKTEASDESEVPAES